MISPQPLYLKTKITDFSLPPFPPPPPHHHINIHTHTHTHFLPQQQRILADLDKERHEEFRRYEMQMEHRRREKLKQMDEEHRAAAERQHEEMQHRLREHERLKHPASKEQLEDVWKNQDGFPGEAFDAKTFFHLHDKNGDKHLDAMELEALFYNEVRHTLCPPGEGVGVVLWLRAVYARL